MVADQGLPPAWRLVGPDATVVNDDAAFAADRSRTCDRRIRSGRRDHTQRHYARQAGEIVHGQNADSATGPRSGTSRKVVRPEDSLGPESRCHFRREQSGGGIHKDGERVGAEQSVMLSAAGNE